MFDDIFSQNDIHLLAASLIVHIRCCEHDLYRMHQENADTSEVESLINECENLFYKIKAYSDEHNIELILNRCEPTSPAGFPD